MNGMIDRNRFDKPIQFCRECGCHALDACIVEELISDEGCHWAEQDLCSGCADPDGRVRASTGHTWAKQHAQDPKARITNAAFWDALDDMREKYSGPFGALSDGKGFAIVTDGGSRLDGPPEIFTEDFIGLVVGYLNLPEELIVREKALEN